MVVPGIREQWETACIPRIGDGMALTLLQMLLAPPEGTGGFNPTGDEWRQFDGSLMLDHHSE